MTEKEPQPKDILIDIGGSPDNLYAQIMTASGRIDVVAVDSFDFYEVAKELDLDLPGPGDYTRAFELQQERGTGLEISGE